MVDFNFNQKLILNFQNLLKVQPLHYQALSSKGLLKHRIFHKNLKVMNESKSVSNPTPMHHWVLAGGTGFLGQILTQYAVDQGHRVTVLSRKAYPDQPNVRYVEWDGKEAGPWMLALEGATALINLAGRSVDCRYIAKNKADIYASRLDSTRILGEAMALCEQPPKVWINLSSATYYRHAEDSAQDENTGEAGTGFSVDVVQQWEHTFFEAQVPAVRKVALRCAMVMGPQGGPFPVLRSLAQWGLGGAAGNGHQYVSWLHHLDFARIIQYIIQCPQLSGAVNASAPDPLPNRVFMQVLRKAHGIPFGINLPKPGIRLGAWLKRTEAELLLKSRWVLPSRLQEAGFDFLYPTWAGACRSLANSRPRVHPTPQPTRLQPATSI